MSNGNCGGGDVRGTTRAKVMVVVVRVCENLCVWGGGWGWGWWGWRRHVQFRPHIQVRQ
jgi:hypothetical protein